MTFRRITKRDKPETLAKNMKECEQLLQQALLLAAKLAKGESKDVKAMIASARVGRFIGDYKVGVLEYPNPKYNSTWSSNMSWNDILDLSVEELAMSIVLTVRHNLYASKHGLHTQPAKRRSK